MKNIRNYIDSTYLKTSSQSGLSEEQTKEKVYNLAKEAMNNSFFAIMIRPEYVREMKEFITTNNSSVVVGTVIGFHEGTYSLDSKLEEAQKAINDGADELDFVINYEAFKRGDIKLVEREFVDCTSLALKNNKIIKWIIEIVALSDDQIADITSNIANWAEKNFPERVNEIFVKSSTGFYITENGKPNGATREAIKIMLIHAGKLPVKAAGGVKTPKEAKEMLDMGVKRIGTSSAISLIEEGYVENSDY